MTDAPQAPADGCLHLLLRAEPRRRLCLNADQARCLDALTMAYLDGLQACYAQVPGARAFVERALRTHFERAAWQLLAPGQQELLAEMLPARASQPRLQAIA